MPEKEETGWCRFRKGFCLYRAPFLAIGFYRCVIKRRQPYDRNGRVTTNQMWKIRCTVKSVRIGPTEGKTQTCSGRKKFTGQRIFPDTCNVLPETVTYGIEEDGGESRMEDAKILELYWSRDPKAIDQSKEKYGSYCFSVANHILQSREDSEECVNDTWFQAWNRIPPHRPNVLRMFLAKITRSVALNRFRACTAQKRGSGQVVLVLEELSECLAGEANVEEQVIAEELGESIRRFVRELPVREGDIFSRRYFFTESIGEIAKSYGLRENHVAVLLNRSRKKLKDHLRKEGFLHGFTGVV